MRGFVIIAHFFPWKLGDDTFHATISTIHPEVIEWRVVGGTLRMVCVSDDAAEDRFAEAPLDSCRFAQFEESDANALTPIAREQDRFAEVEVFVEIKVRLQERFGEVLKVVRQG